MFELNTTVKVNNSILIISTNKANFCSRVLFPNPSVIIKFYSKKFSLAILPNGINFLIFIINDLSIQYLSKYFI